MQFWYCKFEILAFIIINQELKTSIFKNTFQILLFYQSLCIWEIKLNFNILLSRFIERIFYNCLVLCVPSDNCRFFLNISFRLSRDRLHSFLSIYLNLNIHEEFSLISFEMSMQIWGVVYERCAILWSWGLLNFVNFVAVVS